MQLKLPPQLYISYLIIDSNMHNVYRDGNILLGLSTTYKRFDKHSTGGGFCFEL